MSLSDTGSTPNKSTSSSAGPELRGGNITLDMIFAKQHDALRQTKIIGTLGPACWSEQGLKELIENGLSVARFNFSHGDHETHQATLDRLRKVCKEMKKHVGELTGCMT